MNKIIVSIMTIAVITSVLAFAGCVGKDTSTEKTTGIPTVTPSPTSTPKQVVSTPTPTSTAAPKKTVNVTLKAGYKWYQNDDFGYRIGYPEKWDKIDVSLSKGQESGVSFLAHPSEQSPGPGEASISVIVYSDPKQAKFWKYPQILTMSNDTNMSIDKLKELGIVSKYGNITINGIEGHEVVFNPFPQARLRLVVFTVNDLYYMVNTGTRRELYDKYNGAFDDAINSFVIEK